MKIILKDTQCLMPSYVVINVCQCISSLETPQTNDGVPSRERTGMEKGIGYGWSEG